VVQIPEYIEEETRASLAEQAEFDSITLQHIEAKELGKIEGSVMVKDETICIRCGLCAERCPVMNEHVPVLIEMRRHLVGEGDMDKSLHIDFKEATLLGLALSINNIGGGLSAGMIGINAFAMGFLSAVVNFIALWAGNYVAEFFMRYNLHRKAGFLGGIILIAIGIEQIM
jgi:ferredoxin